MATAPYTLKSVRLDEPIHCADVTVAAVVEQTLYGGFPWTGSFHGTKRPLALIVHRRGHTLVFETDGTPLALEELAARFPGLGIRDPGPC